MSNADWRKLRQAIEDFGCETKIGGGGSHIKVFYENRLITSIPGTPGDNRAMQNTLGDLRRRIPGFDYRPKQSRSKREQNQEDE